MAKIKRLTDFNDQIGFIVLSAPERFPLVGVYGVDQKQNLQTAFNLLFESFFHVEERIKDAAQIEHLRQLLHNSLSAYQKGDKKGGAHLLQDFQNIVFPDRFKEYTLRKEL